MKIKVKPQDVLVFENDKIDSSLEWEFQVIGHFIYGNQQHIVCIKNIPFSEDCNTILYLDSNGKVMSPVETGVGWKLTRHERKLKVIKEW